MLWLLLVGCIFVYEDGSMDSGVWDSGYATDTCFVDLECRDNQECVSGACVTLCLFDDDCQDNFACGDPLAPNTAPDGCVERCSTNWDCKAGAVCLENGLCE